MKENNPAKRDAGWVTFDFRLPDLLPGLLPGFSEEELLPVFIVVSPCYLMVLGIGGAGFVPLSSTAQA